VKKEEKKKTNAPLFSYLYCYTRPSRWFITARPFPKQNEKLVETKNN
jgi:hypothetical protein